MTSLDATDSWYFLPTRNSNDAELGAVAMLVWDGLLEAWTRRLRFDFDGVPRLRARVATCLGFPILRRPAVFSASSRGRFLNS